MTDEPTGVEKPIVSHDDLDAKPGFFEKVKEWWHGMRVRWANHVAPKVDALRTDKDTELPEFFVPESLPDLVWFLKRVPEGVLTPNERKVLVSSMTFSDSFVADIMLPRNQITFVHENDFMGPITLDRLYQTGFSHFPVLGARGEITGVLHTKALNSLEIKETDRASAYLDPNVYYMRDNYTLEQAMAAFLRTNCYFFMVVNSNGTLVGLLTFKMLISHLLGKAPEDDFEADGDVDAVAKR